MRVVAPYSNHGLDERLALAFIAGVNAHGDDGVAISAVDSDPEFEADAVLIFGVKQREKFEEHRAAGRHTVYLDKGYIRGRMRVDGKKECEFWRVAIDAHHPTEYLDKIPDKRDRWEEFDIEPKPWRIRGNHIVLAGSSAKFHRFSALPEPTEYNTALVQQIQRMSTRPIIYRPKPSWREAKPIEGTHFSRHRSGLSNDLAGAHAMVTFGSNACFDAVLQGIPSVVIGNGVAKPISSVSIGAIESPYLAKDGERAQWLHRLAYCQWSMAEMASGEAWPHIRRMINGQ